MAAHAVEANGDSGVGIARQFLELLLLRLGPGKLTADDYYKMRVYRRNLSLTEKKQYLSLNGAPARLRAQPWDTIARDKLVTYGVLDSQSIPIPEIHAICHFGRTFRDAPTLQSSKQIEAYLRESAAYPFFAKPIMGIFSEDAVIVSSLDRNSKEVRLGDGSIVSTSAFAETYNQRRTGYIFEELLRPHPDVVDLVGARICTLRLIVFFDCDGTKLFCALWKIAAGGNMADNYWRRGNLLALLDRDTGQIERCMTGLGADWRMVTHHPETGKRLLGEYVPCWEQAVEVTLKAARVFPGLPVQAWDIALTDRGVVALEVNVIGSPFLPQIARSEGLIKGEFAEFMSRFEN